MATGGIIAGRTCYYDLRIGPRVALLRVALDGAFTARDFLNLGSRTAIDDALSRVDQSSDPDKSSEPVIALDALNLLPPREFLNHGKN